MFSGIGGFEYGIQQATNDQLECVGYSEIDKYAIQVYQKHFPTHKNWGDAIKINPAELPDFDLLVGGFPCQSFSLAGKRKGFEDTRGTLFFEIARILKTKRPSTCLLENVKGLVNHDGGKTFATILTTLSELGYHVEWQVLNSKFFGVPQNRERVFIVERLGKGSSIKIFPLRQISEKFDEGEEGVCTYDSKEERRSGVNIKSRLLENGTRGNLHRRIHQMNNPIHSNNRIYGEEGISPALNTAQGGNRQPKIVIPTLTPNRLVKRQKGRRFKQDGDESFTLTGQDVHGVMITSHSPRSGDQNKGGTGLLESKEHCFTIDSTPHYVNNIRRLTPTECARLQSFPDKWCDVGIDEKGNEVIISDTNKYKMFGNAVTTNVIEAIIKRMFSND